MKLPVKRFLLKGPRVRKRLLLLTCILIGLCSSIMAEQQVTKVSLDVADQPLDKVFKKIEAKTDYVFWYKMDVLKKAHRVTLKVNNQDILQVLESIFKNQVLTYSIEKNVIAIKEKQSTDLSAGSVAAAPVLVSTGKVLNEDGQPLPGVIV